MSTVDKNKLRPCGSGLNPKQCSGRGVTPSRHLVGAFIDVPEKQIFHVAEDVLINQLKSEAPKIQESFDRLCEQDLREISNLFALATLVAFGGWRRAISEEDARLITCGQLLFNASQTLVAALATLRDGFRLQPGILVRSMMEDLSAVVYLVMNPDDLEFIRQGTVPLGKMISAAKQVLPPFGTMYGFFSQQFVHVGSLHLILQPQGPYSGRDEALEGNLTYVRSSTWLLFVVSELTFLEQVHNPRYWRIVGDGQIAYDPSPQERQWQSQFLRVEYQEQS